MHVDFGLKDHRAEQEYLCTNGLGSFCSGLVSGGRNRRYHGLLCASLLPPTERSMIVSHLIETVEINNKVFPLSQEPYLGGAEKEPISSIFETFPYPVWKFSDSELSLEKKCWMTPEENTTNVTYTNTGNKSVELTLKPLLAFRNYHSLRQNHDDFESTITPQNLVVSCSLSSVYCHHSEGEWQSTNHWYHDNFYATEKSRGYDFLEELFNPAQITVTLKPGKTFSCQFSLEPTPFSVKKSLNLVERNYKLLDKLKLSDWGKDVSWSAMQSVVSRKSTNTKTILAGYPWFTDWGRDTLISLRSFQYFLPKKDVESIIIAFLKYEKNGLIPNRFPDKSNDKIEYNTVDATLWLFVVLKEVFDLKADKKFLKSLTSTLKRIINSHIEGTSFNIKCDPETGFLHAGKIGQQLTWMDARIGEKVITPRSGYPVEIQALWYNALKIYEEISGEYSRTQEIISQLEINFENYFWNGKQNTLNDFLDKDFTPNTQVRPNQIYTLSLPFSLLDKDKSTEILLTLKSELLTSLGLRTLAPSDPGFKHEYKGDQWDRDHAYHQGTVWPFLLQDYWKAYEKNQGTEALNLLLSEDINPLIHHFYHDSGIGGMSEVFDGALPKKGKGCPQQAWSLASLVWAANKLKGV